MARTPQIQNRQVPVTPPTGGMSAPPPSLFAEFMSSPLMPPAQTAGTGLAGALPFIGRGAGAMPRMTPSYQVGGQVGPGGMPIRPQAVQQQAGLQQAGQQGPMAPQMVEMRIQQFVQQRPDLVSQIQAAVNEGLMSGELTQQELNTMVQLATTVLRNPNLYPQVRQFAIQQGLATEADLSPQYDEGIVIALVIAGRAAQANVGGQNMMAGGSPQMAQQRPIQSLEKGGRVQGTDSEPVLIEAHTGEYVIPKHIVEMKGREFFDRMLEQYIEKNDS
jgi:hypothetical protein